MAINANVSRVNNHHSIIGASGSGKTSFLKSKQSPLAHYQFIIFWDVDEDHECTRYRYRSTFAHGLAQAVRSGKPYRIGLTLDNPSPEHYEFFCRCVWEIADGKRNTAVVVEELADVVGMGKAGRYAGQVLRKGRKYGLDFFAVSQRPAEIDKTTYTQCVNRWCGYIDNEIDIRRMSGLMNVSAEQIKSLKQLEYFYKKNGEREPKKGKVRR